MWFITLEPHFIQSSVVTDRNMGDSIVIEELMEQLSFQADHFTADRAYDSMRVYHAISKHSPNAQIIIHPVKDAAISWFSHTQRNQTIRVRFKPMDKCNGRENAAMGNVNIQN